MGKKIEIKINDKNIPLINKILKEIESEMKIQPNGKVSCPYSFKVDIRKEILRSKIQVKDFEDKKDDLREEIFLAIVNLKRKRIVGIDSEKLKNELSNQIKMLLNRPKKEFIIIFPIHATGELMRQKRWFKIFDINYKVYNWSRIQKLRGWKDFMEQVKTLNFSAFRIDKKIVPLMTQFTPLLVSVRARTAHEAFQEANYKYEIMRSILNFHFSFGVVKFQVGPPKPLGKLYPPPLYPIFDSNGKFLTLYYNKEPYIYHQNLLKKDLEKKFNSFLARVVKMEDEIQSLFVDSLQKYVQALDTYDWRDSFRSLWQILENLSLNSVESNLKMAEVASRIKNLLGPKVSLEKLLVDGLVETRNKLVHLGKFSKDGLKEVNYLKIVTDRALSNFFFLLNNFPTKKNLSQFFEKVTLNEKALKENRKDIDSLLKMREEQKKYL